MKYRNLSFSILMCMLIIACKEKPHNAMKEAPATQADILQKEVIDAHDIAMAKMMKVENYTQQLQNMSDSLNKLFPRQQTPMKMPISDIDSAIKQLNYADVAMNKWMNEFNLDSNRNDEKLRIQYLTSEKEKVTKMKDAVLSSLTYAEAILNRK